MIDKQRFEQIKKRESEFGQSQQPVPVELCKEIVAAEVTPVEEEKKQIVTTAEEKEIKFQPVSLYANFFPIVSDPKLMISQFKIEVTPEISEAGEMRNWLFKKLLR